MKHYCCAPSIHGIPDVMTRNWGNICSNWHFGSKYTYPVVLLQIILIASYTVSITIMYIIRNQFLCITLPKITTQSRSHCLSYYPTDILYCRATSYAVITVTKSAQTRLIFRHRLHNLSTKTHSNYNHVCPDRSGIPHTPTLLPWPSITTFYIPG